MIRKLNRAFQDYMRPKRLALGKWMWDRKDKKEVLNMENIKSILILRYDGKIGDMVVNTLMFREIKKAYPKIKIGVVTKGAAKSVIKNNPYVDKIYDYEDKNIVKEIEKEKYDLLIDFTEMLRVNQMKFINKCKAKINMGLEKEGWNLFDVSVTMKKDEHITLRYREYMRKMGIETENVGYDFFLDSESRKFAEKSLKEFKNNNIKNFNKKKIAVLNPYGASKHKNFNEKTLEEIIEILDEKNYGVVMIYSPDKYSELKSFVERENKIRQQKSKKDKILLPEGIKSILQSGALIEKADLVITPDTSIVHIASAFKKRVISVYPPKGGAFGMDHLVWRPLEERNRMIFCEDKRSEKDEIDINTFNMKEMREELDRC